MGKAEDEQVLDAVPASPVPQLENAARSCPPCRWVGWIESLRCVAALLLGVAVLLSAVFWLPPFFRRGSVVGGLDRDPYYGADVVASFRLQKPISVLNSNVAKLQYDIFDEIGVPNTIVSIMSLEPADINSTIVVFGMWPYPKNSNISTGLSILRSSFVSLILGQSALHLTTSLFGSSYLFQVLQFPGGITIIPPQNAFLLQQEHMLFNFTLNFPIYQVQGKIDDLKDQMKLGLHLKSYEILFVCLTNIRGSTAAPPTVVETSIVLAVLNNQPSVPRLKQLAQNIRNSSAGNLGLNHTIFGRVKQIRLSSFLQHSLNTGAGSSLSPSPAPQPIESPHHHHHFHHHNVNHGHHSDGRAVAAPAPETIVTHLAPPPSGCCFGISSDPKRKPAAVPVAAPVATYDSYPPLSDEGVPASSPYLHPKSHMPVIIFARARPPSQTETNSKPHEELPSISPSASSSCVAGPTKTRWILAILMYSFVRLIEWSGETFCLLDSGLCSFWMKRGLPDCKADGGKRF